MSDEIVEIKLEFSVVEVIAKEHRFGEATGGYTECICGWPTEEEWRADESELIHVLEILEELSEGRSKMI